jgi:hypothetical protein
MGGKEWNVTLTAWPNFTGVWLSVLRKLIKNSRLEDGSRPVYWKRYHIECVESPVGYMTWWSYDEERGRMSKFCRVWHYENAKTLFKVIVSARMWPKKNPAQACSCLNDVTTHVHGIMQFTLCYGLFGSCLCIIHAHWILWGVITSQVEINNTNIMLSCNIDHNDL